VPIVDMPGGPLVSCEGGWYPGMSPRCVHLLAGGRSLALCPVCAWWLLRHQDAERRESQQMAQAELLCACRDLVKLTDNPQQGLATWNLACVDAVERIKAALRMEKGPVANPLDLMIMGRYPDQQGGTA
jgi:hypothetical protein